MGGVHACIARRLRFRRLAVTRGIRASRLTPHAARLEAVTVAVGSICTVGCSTASLTPNSPLPVASPAAWAGASPSHSLWGSIPGVLQAQDSNSSTKHSLWWCEHRASGTALHCGPPSLPLSGQQTKLPACLPGRSLPRHALRPTASYPHPGPSWRHAPLPRPPATPTNTHQHPPTPTAPLTPPVLGRAGDRGGPAPATDRQSRGHDAHGPWPWYYCLREPTALSALVQSRALAALCLDSHGPRTDASVAVSCRVVSSPGSAILIAASQRKFDMAASPSIARPAC